MIKNNENIITVLQLGKTVQKFITTIDGFFVEPKKEEEELKESLKQSRLNRKEHSDKKK